MRKKITKDSLKKDLGYPTMTIYMILLAISLLDIVYVLYMDNREPSEIIVIAELVLIFTVCCIVTWAVGHMRDIIDIENRKITVYEGRVMKMDRLKMEVKLSKKMKIKKRLYVIHGTIKENSEVYVFCTRRKVISVYKKSNYQLGIWERRVIAFKHGVDYND